MKGIVEYYDTPTIYRGEGQLKRRILRIPGKPVKKNLGRRMAQLAERVTVMGKHNKCSRRAARIPRPSLHPDLAQKQNILYDHERAVSLQVNIGDRYLSIIRTWLENRFTIFAQLGPRREATRSKRRKETQGHGITETDGALE